MRWSARGLAGLGVAGLLASTAEAHFVLQKPEASTEQNLLGDPQKAPPCGDDGDADLTGITTTFAPGETITIKIKETIPHPGHYRVALAVNDPSELPAEPEVTPGTTPCGSAAIDPDPQFPVLADGVLVHTAPFDGPQTFEVTLPDDVTCEHCTLQVIEFMSSHGLNNPGGCFYHHCADIAILAEDVDDTDVGDTDGDQAGAGCSCATPGDAAAAGLPWLVLLAVARRRR
jgi:MYXO-CTERM domain-containing protein